MGVRDIWKESMNPKYSKSMIKMGFICKDKCNNLKKVLIEKNGDRYLNNNYCTVCSISLSKEYGVRCPCCNVSLRKKRNNRLKKSERVISFYSY